MGKGKGGVFYFASCLRITGQVLTFSVHRAGLITPLFMYYWESGRGRLGGIGRGGEGLKREM